MKWMTQYENKSKIGYNSSYGFFSKSTLGILCAIVFLLAGPQTIAQHTVAYLHTPNSTTKKANISINKEGNIPFELVHGMIIMQAQVDERMGQFILDTGAPLVVINDLPQVPSQIAASFKQEIAVGETTIDHFSWAGLEKKDLDALVLDISHLESAFKQPLKGMIGYNVLNAYEVFFNYDEQYIIRYPARKNELHHTAKPLYTIPFELYDHLPVITIKVGKKKLRLGLDTGACANLLDEHALATIGEQLTSALPNEEVQGLDQSINLVQAVSLKQLSIKDLVIENTKFLATALPQLQTKNGFAVHGLLGYSFLSRFKFSINYAKGKIYIWE